MKFFATNVVYSIIHLKTSMNNRRGVKNINNNVLCADMYILFYCVYILLLYFRHIFNIYLII